MRRCKWLAMGVVVVLLVVGGAAWVERASLRAWYVVRGLRKADETEREAWVKRIADLREPPADGLLDCLDGDERSRDNASAALAHLAHTWGAGHPRTADLAARLARGYGRLGAQGQASLLGGMAGWLDDVAPSSALVAACSRLLGDAAGGEDEALGGALALSSALMRHPETCEARRAVRDAARAGLRSASANNRLRAVSLGLLPGVDLLDEIAGLLHDGDVGVRRAAVVAVGPSDQAVRDEGLLPCLHDDDAEVRRLAEEALRGRGLSPRHLCLGRLLTHPAASQRLRVLDYLDDEQEDPGLWLRRLSHDQSPAVRVAAVRVMSEQKSIDLSDRIDQMASSDPDPTVAQLARYYLHATRRR